MEEPIRRQKSIDDYNRLMGGVDAFGQLASTCRLLRRSKKSWKCMFYDLVEVAAINSYLLMQEYRQEFPDSMPQPTSYSQSEYRANRASQFAGKAAGEPLPLKVRGRKQRHQETKRMVGGGGGGLTSCSRYKAQLLFVPCWDKVIHRLHCLQEPQREC